MCTCTCVCGVCVVCVWCVCLCVCVVCYVVSIKTYRDIVILYNYIETSTAVNEL